MAMYHSKASKYSINIYLLVSPVCLMQTNCGTSHKRNWKVSDHRHSVIIQVRYLVESTQCSGKENVVSKYIWRGEQERFHGGDTVWVSPEGWLGFYEADTRDILLVTCRTQALVWNSSFICSLGINSWVTHIFWLRIKREEQFFWCSIFHRIFMYCQAYLWSWSLSQFS